MRKIFYLLISICGLSLFADAQIQFNKIYGGQYNDDGRWMEQLPDSGYILTGGTISYSEYGQSDVWLIRTDLYGNVVWNKAFGSSSFDFANCVKRTPDGGFLACGITTRNGSNDGYLVKTDGGGNLQWEKVIGDTGIQEFEKIILTADGGFATIGITTINTNGWYDMQLSKFDLSGTVLWQKNFGGQGYEIGNSLQQTADGGFILAGQTYSFGNQDGDFFMVKTDASGNLVWQKTIAYDGLQECHYVQLTPDNGYILSGDADGLSNGLGDTDMWLVKTNSTGDTLWTRSFGGNKKDGGKTVEVTTDGGFIVAGITRSFNLINPNFFLVKTDNAGAVQWQNYSYGGVNHDHAYRGIQTSDGGYAEFGFFRSAQQDLNYSLVKLGPNGGIVKDVSVDNFANPNPTICRSNNDPISVVLSNQGSNSETGVTITVKIDNGTDLTTLQKTYSGTIAPGQSVPVTMNQTYNFNRNGSYTVTAFINHLSGDISYSNDTLSQPVSVISPTSDPITIPGINCNNGTATLTASPIAAADSLFWYDAATSGNLVGTGTSFITPSLNNSTDYFVKAVKGVGSKVGPADSTISSGSASTSGKLYFDSRTNFVLVSVKVYAGTSGNRTIELRDRANTLLQSKTVNLSPGATRVYLNFSVPPGNDFSLGLSSSSGSLFRNTGGAQFPYSVSRTVEIYGTNSGSTSTFYYFYDWNIFVPYDNCGSNMVTVPAFIGTNQSGSAFDRIRCGPGSLTLQANSNDALSWYDAANGGNLLSTGNSYTTQSLAASTTFYLEAGSCNTRVPVQAIISDQSIAPVATDSSRCGPGSLMLSATAIDAINWFDAASNGTLVGSGNSFTTPELNTTATYFAIAGTACPSPATSVNAIINAAPSPVASNVNACGPANVSLSATATDPITWYDSQNGGTQVGTGNTIQTGTITVPVTYYAQANGSCPSVRTAVTANVVTVDLPVAQTAQRCGSGTLVLTAQSIDNISWWSSLTAGTQLGTGAVFTTPSLSSSATYFIQASNSGCNSQRVPVVAGVTDNSAPVVTGGSNCGAASITLTASASNTISWFVTSSGGTAIASGSIYHTPVISNTATYYVEQSANGCTSARVPVTATIFSAASVDLGPGAVTILSGQSVVFDAGAGWTQYLWNTNATTRTITVSAAGTYWVRVTNSNGCQASDTVTVTILTSVKEVAEKFFSVYPNPSQGIINIETEYGSYLIEISDVTGKIITKDQINNSDRKQFDLSAQPKGTYFIRLTNDKGSYVRQVLIN